MATPKLWISPGACSLVPHIIIREAGIDFELVVINVKAGFPNQHRNVNPKGRVPILQLGEETITEVPAILTAISQFCPEKHLLGKTNLDIVRTYEWLNWLSGSLHAQAFGGIRRPHRWSDDEGTYDSIRAKGKKNLVEWLDLIEGKLKGTHAVGDDFTVVDAFLIVIYRWSNQAGIDMREKYPKITALVLEAARRESVAAALKKEGVDIWSSN